MSGCLRPLCPCRVLLECWGRRVLLPRGVVVVVVGDDVVGDPGGGGRLAVHALAAAAVVVVAGILVRGICPFSNLF